MNIDSIQNGVVLDHIQAGKSMDIYRYLHLDELDCSVAIIKNVRSGRMGKKDIIKIDSPMEVDLDVLGYIDPNITVNIIRNGVRVEKKHLELSLTSACNHIFDIAGVRVVCPYIKDVYLIRDRLLDQDDIYIMEIKDYIEHPKKNGYRSLHMIIRVPVYFMNKKQFVPVEVQIRTEAMDLWASLEHDIKYKSLYQDIGVDFTGELLECSQLIYQAEEKMEFMNNLLED